MKNFFFTILILLISHLYADDVFVYNFNATVINNSGNTQPEKDDESILRLSSIFQKTFTVISSDAITYKSISGQASNKISGAIRTIDNTVNALAVCFFFGIENVMYGDVLMDKKKSLYTTQIRVYSKSQNDVIYELRYSKQVLIDEETYAKELADVVNGQLKKTLQSLPQSQSEKTIEKLQGKIEQSETQAKEKTDAEKQAQEKDEKLLSYMEKLIDTLQKNEQPTKGEEKAVNKEKAFGYYIGIGCFFEFAGVWKDITVPLASIQTGPKINILVVDTSSFDLYLRPGFFVDYSFSMNTNDSYYHRITRIHSLAGAIGLDFFFEFGDIFGFSLGGGGQYNFDFIDFRVGVTQDYYSYQTFALGAFGNVSLEFVLGNEKNLVMGINNIIHFIFYNTTYIDYRILITTMFKI